MIAVELLEKARRAAESAAVLLEDGDLDGAASRAYYAMFHAARAALESEGVQTGGRKHGTILGEFSRQFVKTNRVPREFGRILNVTQELRHEADYEGAALPNTSVHRAVSEAKRFVATIETLLGRSD